MLHLGQIQVMELIRANKIHLLLPSAAACNNALLGVGAFIAFPSM
jgi:hypothetical protein